MLSYHMSAHYYYLFHELNYLSDVASGSCIIIRPYYGELISILSHQKHSIAFYTSELCRFEVRSHYNLAAFKLFQCKIFCNP